MNKDMKKDKRHFIEMMICIFQFGSSGKHGFGQRYNNIFVMTPNPCLLRKFYIWFYTVIS